MSLIYQITTALNINHNKQNLTKTKQEKNSEKKPTNHIKLKSQNKNPNHHPTT